MLIKRLLRPSMDYHFFLFGARGVGKSTLLSQIFLPEHTVTLNLLDPSTEEQLINNPGELRNLVHALPDEITHIVIDEIQKIPKLLDVVHMLIEEKKKIFVMTGSSARKLKRGAANLLAGRAFVYHLFPFSAAELKESFDLTEALTYGTLPQIHYLSNASQKEAYLIGYAHTYLKEEVAAEQLVRKLDPFRKFLEVSAQYNGKIVNFSNIAKNVGVNDKTVREYFSILEDTLIGFFLEPFRHSFQKRLRSNPKFYYFDVGVARALARLLTVPMLSQTSYFGEVFEHHVILECIKMANYFKPEYRFSYFQTGDGAEIDLIVDRPGKPYLLIEIKSTDCVEAKQTASLQKLSKDFTMPCESVCFSRDIYAKKLDTILVLPWQEGVKRFFMEDKNE